VGEKKGFQGVKKGGHYFKGKEGKEKFFKALSFSEFTPLFNALKFFGERRSFF